MGQDEVSNMKYSEPIIEAVHTLSFLFRLSRMLLNRLSDIKYGSRSFGPKVKPSFIWMGSQVLKRLGGSRWKQGKWLQFGGVRRRVVVGPRTLLVIPI